MNIRLLLPTVRVRARFVQEHLGAGPRFHDVLDVGCGEGDLQTLWRPLVGRLAAAEANPNDLARARGRAPESEREGFRLVVGGRLPWEECRFDAVLCLDVVEHVDDAPGLLAELFRVLRPGGTLLLTAPNADFPWSYDPVHRFVGRRLGPFGAFAYGHRALPERGQLVDWAANAGFVEVISTPLVGGLAAFPEAYWAGIAQRLFKVNHDNRAAGSTRGLWLADGAPPGLPLVDRLLDADASRVRPGDPSVGLALVARRPPDGLSPRHGPQERASSSTQSRS